MPPITSTTPRRAGGGGLERLPDCPIRERSRRVPTLWGQRSIVRLLVEPSTGGRLLRRQARGRRRTVPEQFRRVSGVERRNQHPTREDPRRTEISLSALDRVPRVRMGPCWRVHPRCYSSTAERARWMCGAVEMTRAALTGTTCTIRLVCRTARTPSGEKTSTTTMATGPCVPLRPNRSTVLPPPAVAVPSSPPPTLSQRC